jgi:hypothetical protein
MHPIAVLFIALAEPKKTIASVAGMILEGIASFITNPDEFWGLKKDVPTLTEQIEMGHSKTDEELDLPYLCPHCRSRL